MTTIIYEGNNNYDIHIGKKNFILSKDEIENFIEEYTGKELIRKDQVQDIKDEIENAIYRLSELKDMLNGK